MDVNAHVAGVGEVGGAVVHVVPHELAGALGVRAVGRRARLAQRRPDVVGASICAGVIVRSY